MNTSGIISSFLIAALLGLLIGLERERKREQRGSLFAGITTFPLIALFGALSSELTTLFDSVLILIIAFIPIAIITALAYWRESSGDKVSGTSHFAVLVTFVLGVLAGHGEHVPALAGAVIVTGILSIRDELRVMVGGLTREDMYAVVQFAAVSLVVLPLVPNEAFGPWQVWNPRSIWLLVVLISGVSFVGYLLSKVISAERGIGFSGIIGGIASSTAVTLSFSERSKSNAPLAMMFASGVLVATAVSMMRLLVLIGVVEKQLLVTVLPAIVVYCLITAVGGWLIFRSNQSASVEGAKLSNPFELRTALKFAVLFALILLISRAAQEFFGDSGVFLASSLAGVTQLDAITLALSKQVGQGLDPATAAKGLSIALMTNSLFKSSLAISLGNRRYARSITIVLVIAGVCALVVAWFFPVDKLTNILNSLA